MALSILKEEFMNASSESLVLNIEALTTDAAADDLSIKELVQYFKENNLNGEDNERFLRLMLPRTMFLINKFNSFFDLPQSNITTLRFRYNTRERDDANSNLRHIIDYLTTLAEPDKYNFDFKGKVVLVGIDHLLLDRGQPPPFKGNYELLDREIAKACPDELLNGTPRNFITFGLSTIRNFLNKKRMESLHYHIEKCCRVLNGTYAFLIPSQTNRSCIDDDVHRAVEYGHKA